MRIRYSILSAAREDIALPSWPHLPLLRPAQVRVLCDLLTGAGWGELDRDFEEWRDRR